MNGETKTINKKLIIICSAVAVAVLAVVLTLVLVLTGDKSQMKSCLKQAQEEFETEYALDMEDGKLDVRENTHTGYYVEKILGELIAKYDKTFKEKYVVTFDGENWKVALVGEETKKPVEPTPASKFEYTKANGGIVITGFKDKEVTEVVIPAEIEGLPVVKVESNAFAGCTALADISAEEGHAYLIGFEGNLYTKDGEELVCYAPARKGTEFKIPTFVSTINDYAFAGSTNLTSVVIPENVKTIGEGAFAGCTGLTSFEIPSSIEKLGFGAFAGCEGLVSITIPFVGEGTIIDTFNDLFGEEGLPTNLKTVVIAEGATKIGTSAFSMCPQITTVVIPSTVKSIDEKAFMLCTGLESVVLPEGLETIAEDAFFGCEGLKTVTLPSTLKVIGKQAFQNCKSLETVVIPAAVEVVSEDAFRSCVSLKEVTLSSGVKSIEEFAFFNCESLSKLIYTGTKAQWDTITKGKFWNDLVAKDYTEQYNG